MMCALILYMSGGTYNLTSTLNDRFFENPFQGKFIYSAERKSPTIYFFFQISFSCLTCDTNPIFTSNKLTHSLFDNVDFLIELNSLRKILISRQQCGM